MLSLRTTVLVARLSAIVLVVLAALQLRADAATAMFTATPRDVIAFAQIATGAVALVGLAMLTLPLRRWWPIAAVFASALGWLAHAAALEPIGHPVLDAALVQGITTLGELALGVAIACDIAEPRVRHSAAIMLAGYAVFGGLTAFSEHRIGVSLDYPTIVALRRDRDFTIAVAHVALAGVMWLYGRWLTSAGGAEGSEGSRRRAPDCGPGGA